MQGLGEAEDGSGNEKGEEDGTIEEVDENGKKVVGSSKKHKSTLSTSSGYTKSSSMYDQERHYVIRFLSGHTAGV